MTKGQKGPGMNLLKRSVGKERVAWGPFKDLIIFQYNFLSSLVVGKYQFTYIHSY